MQLRLCESSLRARPRCVEAECTHGIPVGYEGRRFPGAIGRAELQVDFGGIGVKTDINISVKNIEEKIVDATSTPSTGLLLEWEAATMPGLFPLMKGELSVYPLTSTENTIGFLRGLRTAFRGRVKNHERHCQPPHRRGVGTSLRLAR